MAEFIRRDQLVERQAREDRLAVEQAVATVNSALLASQSLPINLTASLFGESPRVRNEVERRLKLAGYRVEFKPDQRDSDYYEVG